MVRNTNGRRYKSSRSDNYPRRFVGKLLPGSIASDKPSCERADGHGPGPAVLQRVFHGDEFYRYVISGVITGDTVSSLMIANGALGLVAEAVGIYLILRMRTKLIPQGLRIRNYKLMMHSTLVFWTIIAALGFATYYYRYLDGEDMIFAAPREVFRQVLERIGGLNPHQGNKHPWGHQR